MLPKALKTCPKSKKSSNLVTLAAVHYTQPSECREGSLHSHTECDLMGHSRSLFSFQQSTVKHVFLQMTGFKPWTCVLEATALPSGSQSLPYNHCGSPVRICNGCLSNISQQSFAHFCQWKY